MYTIIFLITCIFTVSLHSKETAPQAPKNSTQIPALFDRHLHPFTKACVCGTCTEQACCAIGIASYFTPPGCDPLMCAAGVCLGLLIKEGAKAVITTNQTIIHLQPKEKND